MRFCSTRQLHCFRICSTRFQWEVRHKSLLASHMLGIMPATDTWAVECMLSCGATRGILYMIGVVGFAGPCQTEEASQCSSAVPLSTSWLKPLFSGSTCCCHGLGCQHWQRGPWCLQAKPLCCGSCGSKGQGREAQARACRNGRGSGWQTGRHCGDANGPTLLNVHEGA